MGSWISSFRDAELERCQKPHRLDVHQDTQWKQKALIDHFKLKLKVCFLPYDWRMSVVFNHYFITDGAYTMEFGDYALQDLSMRIYLSKPTDMDINIEKEFQLSDEVKRRMIQVCGSTNFSLALRNSEHVTNYIVTGTWYSLQMTPNAELYKFLAPNMGTQVSLVNTLPQELEDADKQRVTGRTQIYPNWQGHATFKEKIPTLVPSDNDTNILLLGPTGAGKSTILNVLFNERVAKVKASPKSVTRQMEVYTGHYKTKTGHDTTKKVNVIDSVGFCDSVIPPNEVMQIVKAYIKTNIIYLDKVIVVAAGRIEKEQAEAIKSMLSWLGYKHHKSEFVFIYNKAENLDSAEKLQCLGEMGELLNVSVTEHAEDTQRPGSTVRVQVKYGLTTGFPTRARFDEVKGDLEALLKAVFIFRPDGKRIRVEENNCTIL